MGALDVAAGRDTWDLLNKNRGAIQAALPSHLTVDRMLRVSLTEMRKTPELLLCEPKSFLAAIIQASQLGLEPGGALGECYLVPFNNKKSQRKEVQLIVGYRGLINLARRSGQIASISARSVFAGDRFEVSYGLNESLVHEPQMKSQAGAELIAAYAVARLKDGGHQFEVMSRDEIERVKRRARAGDGLRHDLIRDRALCEVRVLLLVGGLVIGVVASPAAFDRVAPLFVDMFSGFLVLFLLDMGATAMSKLLASRALTWRVVAFAAVWPLIAGSIGVALGVLAGLGVGGAGVLGAMAASASYIAACTGDGRQNTT